MEKVLIFTNWESYSTSLAYYCDFNYDSYPNPNNPLKKYCRDDTTFYLKDVEDCADAGVYLVFDDITQERFNALVESTNDCPSYFLLHNRIINNEHPPYVISPAEKRIVRNGSHFDIIYKSIFKILADDEDKKMERIIRVFWPKLETVVRFLNECLIPKNDSSTRFKEYKDLLLNDFKGNNSVSNAVSVFCGAYSNQDKLENYEGQLIALRDALIIAATT